MNEIVIAEKTASDRAKTAFGEDITETGGEAPGERELFSELISSGNLEIDRKLDGGIPAGSLSLLEGINDSGKSILLQQIFFGALRQGRSVLAFATEKSPKNMLKEMESLTLDITDYYIIGKAKIFSIDAPYVEANPQLSERHLQLLLESIQQCKQEIIIIDSLTVFVVNAGENALLNFFTECKKFCDRGKTILISAHGYAFSEALLIRLRSICDAYLQIRIERVGDQLIKTMEILKLRGAQKSSGNVLSFDVKSNFGLKIIPVSKVKA